MGSLHIPKLTNENGRTIITIRKANSVEGSRTVYNEADVFNGSNRIETSKGLLDHYERTGEKVFKGTANIKKLIQATLEESL